MDAAYVRLEQGRDHHPSEQVVHHPQVGALDLRCEKLAITGADRHVLVAHHAEPGSTSARALALLGTVAGDAEPAATAAATS